METHTSMDTEFSNFKATEFCLDQREEVMDGGEKSMKVTITDESDPAIYTIG
jgi:hypothetical protein